MIGALGIGAANDIPVNQGGSNLPSMAATITGYFLPLTLTRVQRQVVDFEVKEALTELTTMGVIQPFGSRDLKLKPEGQRSWGWKMLHTATNVNLKNGEYCYIRGVKYRVMGLLGYSDYGYFQYEVVEGYTDGN